MSVDAKHAEFWERECVRGMMASIASAARQLHDIYSAAPDDADNCEWGTALTAAMIQQFGDDVAGLSLCRDTLAKLAEVIEDSRDGNTFTGG